jgi:hypothetical protein
MPILHLAEPMRERLTGRTARATAKGTRQRHESGDFTVT